MEGSRGEKKKNEERKNRGEEVAIFGIAEPIVSPARTPMRNNMTKCNR